MDFPARVTLLSGAVVLMGNTSQMDALPLGVALESISAAPFDGVYWYREVQPSMAAEAKTLRAALSAASVAMTQAAEALRDGGGSPLKARLAHEAAARATAALAGTVDA